MSIPILPEYRANALHLINTTWFEGRVTKYLVQDQTLVGKLGRLGEGAYWVYFLTLLLPICRNRSYLM